MMSNNEKKNLFRSKTVSLLIIDELIKEAENDEKRDKLNALRREMNKIDRAVQSDQTINTEEQ